MPIEPCRYNKRSTTSDCFMELPLLSQGESNKYPTIRLQQQAQTSSPSHTGLLDLISIYYGFISKPSKHYVFIQRAHQNTSTREVQTRRLKNNLTKILLILMTLANYLSIILAESNQTSSSTDTATVLSNENFTFINNGSFLQLDAGRDWPFNSKREISFRFKTKSPHGLLVYQTFDHNKLVREEDQENLDLIPLPPSSPATQAKLKPVQPESQQPINRHQSNLLYNERHISSQALHRSSRSMAQNEPLVIKHLSRGNRDSLLPDVNLNQLTSSTITATASERLVNSLFSASPAAAINGNAPSRSSLASQMASRGPSMIASSGGTSIVSSTDANAASRSHRGLISDPSNNRLNYAGRTSLESSSGSTILSSSTISSFTASLYELYLKLENGRLKIMYEFGSRLNQTYCGRGLNDDRWHKVDLKVDPELNQMILILDQLITVEIVLSQPQQEDESLRRNELVLPNSVLYLGGLDNTASIVKNLKQRLYMAQFIGCIGQILLKTDQQPESSLQPASIDKMVLVKRGCINKCDTDNYCLHESTCVNYYSHTKCDCFGTNYEDVYCWQDQLTTLSMLGYSTLVYRIYDWRDRHHSSINRLSLQFKTLALDSVLFFAYGDLSAQQSTRNYINSASLPSGTMIQSQGSFANPQVNISNLLTIHRPTVHQPLSNSNYLAVSLSNGTIVVEANFGDQAVLLSNLLYDKVYNRTTVAHNSGSMDTSPTSNFYRPLSLADGRWHNVTFVHNSKQLFLYVDNYSANYTIQGKNTHLYFDTSIYVGAVPNLLLNETRLLARPFNLRHKFVGCLRSVYFNQHNILLALKQGSPAVEYRDLSGKPRLNSCLVQEPSSLPLTMRSGKSYLTFQLTPNSQQAVFSSSLRSDSSQTSSFDSSKNNSIGENKTVNNSAALRKLTRIEFEYKTSLSSHFLAGGHLRDLSYHDLGGFWTLHAHEECELYFTISSGLTFEPEQIIKIESENASCGPKSWYKISISMISGDKILNLTRSKVSTVTKFEDEYFSPPAEESIHRSYILKSSIELLHQVQLGGDLAKFGESSSVPFSGCMRRIKINSHLFDSRDFVTNFASMTPMTMNINQYNSSLAPIGPTQSDVISSRMAQGYVTLDSCQMVIPCASSNPCKNNGTCKINELGEPDCDCSKTGYTGKRCQFSIYKQSCQDLYLSGQRKSSHYLIDLDRNGPLKPVRVRCNMDEGSGHIETVLTHNLPAEYLIRRSSTRDMHLDITYLAFHHMYTSDGFYIFDDDDQNARNNQEIMLRSLIGQSLYCRQYFRYECRSAPLELGNRTWMEAPFPKNHRLTSLDGANHGKCMCATTEKKCLDPTKNCNCDSGESIWSDDSYDLIGHEDVGLTRIVILKQTPEDDKSLNKQQFYINSESQSRFTLSDLKCYGTKQQESHHEITFKTSDAYIELPGWRRGDISFSFRTASNPPAIILYQLATSRNHGYFRLTLISDTRLIFEFIVNRKPRKLYLTSTHKLNNGEWQQVFIEYDSVNLRLTVNDDSAMVDLDTNDYLGTFEGPLFIGGAPSKYLVGDLSKRNGFTGCFRGLNIDGRMIDLKSYLSPSMPTVTSSCKPSCTKNLCQNGGKCIEYWGSYECECSNPIAHSGSNCEINLNTNSITFVTQESYYVQLSNDSLLYPSYLIKNVLLNIRTYQETALILYASDHLNNFIQLHKNGSSLVLTFNSNSTIVIAQVPIEDEPSLDIPISNQASTNNVMLTNIENSFTPLTQINSSAHILPAANVSSDSDHSNKQISTNSTPGGGFNLFDNSIRISNTSGSGQPIQVKIERHRARTTFYVNNNFVVVDKPMIFLTNYTQNPWSNPELELVRPPRPKIGSKTYSQLFLANIDEYFSTRLPGFTGCIQGLSIDNQLFDFNRAHLTGELKGEYRIGCKMHCDSFPCKNHGTCIENWKEDRIHCKCDTTTYVGRLCDEDIAANFNGYSSYFLYHISKRYPGRTTKSVLTYQGNVLNATRTFGPPSLGDLPQEQNLKLVDVTYSINFFEVSLAFSTDLNQSITNQMSSVQVLVLITRANSSKHFFLGLTPDGSLLVQEDYGNSMSLSRLIKRSDQPYNDGHRHMIKYSRFNQTIQIIVDYQTYLPTMGVISAYNVSKFSKSSIIYVGTVDDKSSDSSLAGFAHLEGNFTNYSGCISNLIVKFDDLVIEPLSEAFGQNLDTVNISATKGIENSIKNDEKSDKRPISAALSAANLQSSEEIVSLQDGFSLQSSTMIDEQSRLSTAINKLNGKETNDDMDTIVARDVEQGKCSTFKRVEIVNEKRSINEPKYTPLLEPRPVYMDPPRIKPYKRREIVMITNGTMHKFDLVFYFSLTFLAFVSSSALVYAYILQVRYKSEKFRCETPFFHKRDDVGSESGGT